MITDGSERDGGEVVCHLLVADEYLSDEFREAIRERCAHLHAQPIYLPPEEPHGR